MSQPSKSRLWPFSYTLAAGLTAKPGVIFERPFVVDLYGDRWTRDGDAKVRCGESSWAPLTAYAALRAPLPAHRQDSRRGRPTTDRLGRRRRPTAVPDDRARGAPAAAIAWRTDAARRQSRCPCGAR